MMNPNNHHVAATRRPDKFFGASPPPCNVSSYRDGSANDVGLRGGSNIFRTGAAISTAVVVARSTGPDRPNCEFWFLLQSFAATA
jgi:hypothetical protein